MDDIVKSVNSGITVMLLVLRTVLNAPVTNAEVTNATILVENVVVNLWLKEITVKDVFLMHGDLIPVKGVECVTADWLLQTLSVTLKLANVHVCLELMVFVVIIVNMATGTMDLRDARNVTAKLICQWVLSVTFILANAIVRKELVVLDAIHVSMGS